MRRALILQQEFSLADGTLEHNIAEMKNLIGTLSTCRDNTTGFQTTVSRMPALTVHLKRARKRTSTMLGELIAELQFTIQETEQLLNMISGDDITPKET